MYRRLTSRHLLTLIAVLAIAPLAACGDTESDDGGAGSTDTVADAAPATDTPEADPTMTDPETTDPEATDPETIDPETIELATTEPASTDHATTDHTGADHAHDEEGDEGSAAVATDQRSDHLGSYVLVDEDFGTMTTVTVDEQTRIIETNALPDHETGDFPNGGNPNTITAQDLTWEFPTVAVFTGDATGVRTSGVAVNGVKFEPGTAESATCETGESYRIEALQDVYDLGFDFNNAHVQPGGEYHYHGISELLVGAYESDDDLVHVGFAADGFLMYYSKSGAFDPGYELSGGARTGTGCLASGPNGVAFDIDGTTPDGTYTSDWVFTGTGDLDECNGTTIDGEYAYIVTDTYPFVSRCLNGEVTEDAGGPPPAAGAGQQGGPPPANAG